MWCIDVFQILKILGHLQIMYFYKINVGFKLVNIVSLLLIPIVNILCLEVTVGDNVRVEIKPADTQVDGIKFTYGSNKYTEIEYESQKIVIPIFIGLESKSYDGICLMYNSTNESYTLSSGYPTGNKILINCILSRIKK